MLKKVGKNFAAAHVVVMESTGHYPKILFHYFTKIGLEMLILNPLQSDSIKNISIRKVKNHKIDAFRIVILYKLNQSNIIILPLETIESGICSKTALVVLGKYPALEDILNADRNELISVIQQNSH